MRMFSRLAIPFFGLALVALAACGSSHIGNNQCEGPEPAAFCDQVCSATEPCPSGSYCGAGGTCTADCTFGGSECGTGYQCTDDGHCVAAGTTPDSRPVDARDCPSVDVAVAPQTPTVQLLIDQSGSMNDDFGGVSRWNAVRTALVDPNGGAVTLLENQVKFGASLYTSLGGNAGGACPMLQETSPAFGNRAAIAALLEANVPQSDTPTAESVTMVADTFVPVDPNTPGPRIIILATDGNPDNCVDPDAHNAASQMMSEMAVQGAYAKGIYTYVLSVGDQVALAHLQHLANAGQGLDLANGNATFYVANNSAELVAAFNDIIRGVRSCTFMVDGQVQDPTAGMVNLNGTLLQYGTDWTMPDATTIELLGDACQTFLNDDVVELTAQFPCGTVIL